MSISVSFHLNKSSRYKEAKKLAIIGRVSYSFFGNEGLKKRQFKFATNEKCPVKRFRKGQVDSTVAESSRINARLSNFVRKAKKLYELFEEIKKFPQPLIFKKKLLEDTLTYEEERNLVSDFGLFIEYLSNKGAAKTYLTGVKQTLGHMKTMAETDGYPLDYASMNLDFYARLKKYFLVTNKRKTNTFGGAVKRIKTFLNYAKANGWNKYEFYKLREFKILEEQSPIVALTELELNQLLGLDLKHRPRLDLSRDYFLLGSETGLRYSDFAKITKNRIKEVTGGYNLEVKTKKGGADVIIPLSQLVFNILLKHSFQMELPPTNQKLNENLKTLTELAEINKNVTTHTGRKTFATIQYKMGTPVPWIMKITGHKTEREFYKYIGVDKNENADMVRDMHDKYKIENKGLLERTLKVAK